MFRYFRLVVATIVLSCLVSCERRHHEVTRAFYYWKTTYAPGSFERQTLRQLGVHKMYLRLFDVDVSGTTNQVYPVATVRISPVTETATDIVPVIFITQRTLARLSRQNIGDIATRISNLASAVCSQSALNPGEIQIDCDWTARTKDTYFQLLSILRKQGFFAGKTLSCTIRMHQMKYITSSGVPPVDRGLLMCYNMGNMKKPGTHNSILETEVAKSYLSGMDKYPLALDVALPIFSWSLRFHGHEFAGILREVAPEMLQNNFLFRQLSDNRYQCLYDTMWQGYSFAKNDIVRTEEPTVQVVSAIAAYTSQRVHNHKMSVVFFSCDSVTLSKHSVHDLEAVYHSYQ